MLTVARMSGAPVPRDDARGDAARLAVVVIPVVVPVLRVVVLWRKKDAQSQKYDDNIISSSVLICIFEN